MSDLSKVQSHSHCSLVNNKLSLLTDLFSLISIGPETGAGVRDDRKKGKYVLASTVVSL